MVDSSTEVMNVTSFRRSEPSFGINYMERDRCLNDVLPKPPPDDGHLYCEATFDFWMCWDYTRAGTTSYASCPYYFKPGFNPDAFAEKTCLDAGTWYVHPESNNTWTDYNPCSNNKTNQIVLYLSIIGYSISCILLIASIAIFKIFRQLRCTRVVLHEQLFLSFIFTGIMWIATYATFMSRPWVRRENEVWCKIVHLVTQYFSVSNYFWMFCEGFFLHTIIVQAFSKQKKLLYACYVIGWVIPLLPIVGYLAARVLDKKNDVLCWSNFSWQMWILTTPIAISLVASFLLLLNILRILLSKMRAFNNAEAAQNRRVVKAILILIPLFGLQNLLSMLKPPMDRNKTLIWDTVSAILISYQGVAVALIFCFCNGEVLAVLKRRWSQWRHHYDPAFLGRPNTSTTMAVTLDETTPVAPVYKNGRGKTTNRVVSKTGVESTELELMVPNEKNPGKVAV